MPHSRAERQGVVTRLRRIKGQAEAMGHPVVAGTDGGEPRQQPGALVHSITR